MDDWRQINDKNEVRSIHESSIVWKKYSIVNEKKNSENICWLIKYSKSFDWNINRYLLSILIFLYLIYR